MKQNQPVKTKQNTKNKNKNKNKNKKIIKNEGKITQQTSKQG